MTFANSVPLCQGPVRLRFGRPGVFCTLKMFLSIFTTCLFLDLVQCSPAAPKTISSEYSSGSSSSVRGTAGGSVVSTTAQRLELNIERIGSRIESLFFRMDQLDNRLGRLQSLVSTRLDGLENVGESRISQTSCRHPFRRGVDENLGRRWKAFESKIEAQISSFDTKYESRINLMFREGRRYGDSLQGIFGAAEKRINSLVHQANETLADLTNMYNLTMTKVMNRTSTGLGSGGGASVTPLISTKVTNMFEVLLESSNRVETLVKESIQLGNKTRIEVQDNFRLLLGPPGPPSMPPLGLSAPLPPSSLSRSRSGTSGTSYGQASSEVTTAMAILETLASTESMSTTISRRINDLATSIDERFEMVSMTLNGFQDSCQRIQETTPMIEEQIAILLDKIVTTFENRSSGAAELGDRIIGKLESMETKCEDMDLIGGGGPHYLDSGPNGTLSSTSISERCSSPGNSIKTESSTIGYSDVLRNAARYNETDRKMIEELFLPRKYRNSNSSSSEIGDSSSISPFHVPEEPEI